MQGIPIASGPVDLMRTGFNSLESKMNAPHPVKAIEARAEAVDMRDKLKRVRAIYGSHMAMRIATEKSVLSRPRRLPGLESSSAHLDVVTGRGETIEFSDYLSDPRERADLPKINFHDVVEGM